MNEQNENQNARIVSPAQARLLDHISHLDSGDIAESIERTIDLGLYFGDMPIEREDMGHVYRVRELLKYIDALAEEYLDTLGKAS